MLLLFPNAAILRTALATEAIPGSISSQAANASWDDQGSIWIQFDAPIGKALLKSLREIGVTSSAQSARPLDRTVRCWHELIPLERAPVGPVRSESWVLFEIAGELLPRLVSEMQRLGRRQCGFRWLDSGRALVRVANPPLFTMLRAGGRNEISAFAERQPGVWVEVGYAHPFADRLTVSPSQVLLIRAPWQWAYFADEPFQEVGAMSALTIPASPNGWHDTNTRKRITVPVRLARTAAAEPAELWVLKKAGRDQLQQLINQVDDRLAARLSVALVGRETVVLRLLSQRQPPPVLVLDGPAFRSYLRIPNLFAPCGMRLQPALRRDAVRQLLTMADQVTWLYPEGDGRFVPESLDESAFQPLTEWIEYQRETTASYAAWQGSSLLEMEHFAVEEDAVSRRPAPARPPRPKEAAPSVALSSSRQLPTADDAAPLPAQAEESLAAVEPLGHSDSDELQQRLAELQEAFVAMQAPLDAAERQSLWREMAGLHAALGHAGDAALAWAYACWEVEAIPRHHAQAWLRCEAPLQLDDLDPGNPAPADLRSLVAFLVHAAQGDTPLPAAQLRSLRQLVERHEAALPVRLGWLAHVALFRLTGNDVLALAKARDRMLERLHHHGLRLELDLPSFLRFSGKIGQERLVAVRGHLVRLHEHVLAWLRKHPRNPLTPLYADLTFAFGLARLGATTESERLLADTAKVKADDALHAWLHDAYAARIRQALKGEPPGSALPAALLDRLEGLANDLRYKGDRLRQFSRILEPHQKIDARFRWHQYYPDAIERELAALSGLGDAAELWPRLGALLEDKKRAYRPYRGVILAKALELAPRLGEEFARNVLARVIPGLADLGDALEAQVLILEKGIYLAAHYDQAAYVVNFVERFGQLLAANPPIQSIEPLVGQLFRGLRQLGMRDVVGQLLERLTGLALHGHDLKQLRLRLAKQADHGMLKQELASWKALLHVAAGWLYFGQEEQARPILNETRTFLFQAVLHPLEQTELACGYIRCLGQADLEPAVSRWLELFRKVERIDAVFTTDSHFSLAQLSLVEAMVLTLASDDFTLDPQGRRWLEDDEYQIRSRIHRDVRRAMVGERPT